jgi:plastocyanin
MTRNSKIGIAAIVIIAIIAAGVGAYELAYMPPASSGGGSPTISIISPTNGATVPSTFSVTVSTSNFNIPTRGHIHVYLDSLQNYQLGPGPTFTFTNVAPGTHTIWAQLQNPDHSPLNPPVQTQPITITVMPSGGGSSPTVSIVSPSTGATVAGSTVTVTVASTNFNIPSQGHYWVYLDNKYQAGNGSTFTFTNVAPGTHTIYAQLYNADGTPVSPAVVSQTITITTGSSGSQSPTVSIISPSNGATVQGPAVTVTVSSTNFNTPAHGYYYVSMSNGGFITGNGPTFIFPSVTSGTHTITADLRNPDGSMLSPDVSQTITITVTGSSGGGGYGY